MIIRNIYIFYSENQMKPINIFHELQSQIRNLGHVVIDTFFKKELENITKSRTLFSESLVTAACNTVSSRNSLRTQPAYQDNTGNGYWITQCTSAFWAKSCSPASIWLIEARFPVNGNINKRVARARVTNASRVAWLVVMGQFIASKKCEIRS